MEGKPTINHHKSPVILGALKISSFLSASQFMQIMLLGDGTMLNVGRMA
jgi:hypothetical protein